MNNPQPSFTQKLGRVKIYIKRRGILMKRLTYGKQMCLCVAVLCVCHLLAWLTDVSFF